MRTRVAIACAVFIAGVVGMIVVSHAEDGSRGRGLIFFHVVMSLSMLLAWSARPVGRAVTVILWTGLLARGALAVVPGFTTHDVERYLWDGYVARSGFDPYLHAPNSSLLEPLRAEWPPPRDNTGVATLYPPAALALFGLCTVVGPGGAVWLWRALIVLAALATVVLGARWLHRDGRSQNLPLLALSPLAVVETSVGAHVDALAALAVVAAMVCLRPIQSLLVAGDSREAAESDRNDLVVADSPIATESDRNDLVAAGSPVAAESDRNDLVAAASPIAAESDRNDLVAAGSPIAAESDRNDLVAGERLALARRSGRNEYLVGALLGLGALFKVLPALAVIPLVIGLRMWRVGIAAGLTVGTGYGVALGLGFRPIGSMPVFVERWRFGSPIFAALEHLFGSSGALGVAAAIALGSIAAACLVIRRNLGLGVLLAIAAPLIAGPVVFPWYLLPAVPLIAFAPAATSVLWITAAPLTYEVIDRFDSAGIWEPESWPLIVLGILVAAGALIDVVRFRRARTPHDVRPI